MILVGKRRECCQGSKKTYNNDISKDFSLFKVLLHHRSPGKSNHEASQHIDQERSEDDSTNVIFALKESSDRESTNSSQTSPKCNE